MTMETPTCRFLMVITPISPWFYGGYIELVGIVSQQTKPVGEIYRVIFYIGIIRISIISIYGSKIV